MEKLDEFIEANKNSMCNIKIFTPIADLTADYAEKKYKKKPYFNNQIQSKLIICGVLLEEIAEDMAALNKEIDKN